MFSKSTFVDYSLRHENGNYFLRPDRIFAAFHVDPSNLPIMSGEAFKEMKVERHREHQVMEKLKAAEMKHQENAQRIEKEVASIWRLISELRDDDGDVEEDHMNTNSGNDKDSLVDNSHFGDIELSSVNQSSSPRTFGFDEESGIDADLSTGHINTTTI
jgi:hypothetical protein